MPDHDQAIGLHRRYSGLGGPLVALVLLVTGETFGASFPGYPVLADSILISQNAKPPQASILIAVCLMFGLYSNQHCLTFFSNKLSRYLGRISFPLYLTHFAVLISFTSWAILQMVEFKRFDFAHSLAVATASGVLALGLAELFTRVERRYLMTLNQVVSRAVRS